MDIPDSYKNFEKIISYNESEGSTKIMECCKCISMKKAGRRSSMKIYFHGFGGLGAYTNKLKGILYVQMHCLPISNIYVARVEF